MPRDSAKPSKKDTVTAKLPQPKPHVWLPEHIALLGTRIDKEVAALIGTSKPVVLRKRMALGIQPLKPIAKRLEWTAGMIAALGSMSDVDLAAQIGTRHDIVTKKRAQLGIPPFEGRLNQGDTIVARLAAICRERGGILLDSTSAYKSRSTKLLIRCGQGHVFRTTNNIVQSGAWCRKCANAALRCYSLADLHRFATKRGGHCLSTQYTNSSALYEWECQHGHRWSYPWSNMRKLVRWCPECRILEDGERKAARKRQVATGRKAPTKRLLTGNPSN
jgi:hypothetical protein